jgi:hypothetical protein
MVLCRVGGTFELPLLGFYLWEVRMLGHLYNSREFHYVPCLSHLDHEITIATGSGGESPAYQLYKLDWGLVDSYKANQYRTWVQDHWHNRFPKELEGQHPGTLPPILDQVICSLTYAIPPAYHREVTHFSQLYYMDRLRQRPFDTVIREMCLNVSQAAINCAFKLLADCICDIATASHGKLSKSGRWFRRIATELGTLDKWVIQCLIMYKFWRGATGHGLTWDHAELDKIDNYVQLNGAINHKTMRVDPEQLHMMVRVLRIIKEWETSQEKFWSFTNLGAEGTTVGVESEGQPDKNEGQGIGG